MTTLRVAFEAENVSTAGSDSGKKNGSSVKAGSAFNGAPNSHKIKPDVAGTMAHAIVTANHESWKREYQTCQENNGST
ncbi:MAG: hypothetical protein ACTJLL_00310 [Anaplasma sp.]